MNYLKTLLVFLVLFQSSSALLCQSKAINRDKYVIRITETSEKITLDGVLDEETWKTAERTGMFQRVTPTDTGFAKAQTTVMVAHDGSRYLPGCSLL